VKASTKVFEWQYAKHCVIFFTATAAIYVLISGVF